MKKIILTLIISTCITSVFGQSYVGFHSDNYKGVHGVIFNPASIVDSRLRTDINLVSASALVTNDFLGIDFFDLYKDNFDPLEFGTLFPKEQNSLVVNADVLGPAFMFSIAPKHALAFSVRARGIANVNNINGTFVDEAIDDFDTTNDFTVNEGDINGLGHFWAEAGITYSTFLLDNNTSVLKMGITAKMYAGGGVELVDGSNISLSFDEDGGANQLGQVTTTGEITRVSNSRVYDDEITGEFNFSNSPKAFGGDIGFIYEFRPEYDKYIVKDKDQNSIPRKDMNKYLFKVGLSVTDIATSLSYENSEIEQYNFNNTVDASVFTDFDEDEIRRRYAPVLSRDTYEVNLPTAAHFNIDYNLYKKVYVNLNTDLSLTSRDKAESSSIANTVSFTPRVETKWISFYMPVGYRQFGGAHWGAGFRLGPLMLGSGTVLSNLISDKARTADVYAGLKIPVYYGRTKDKDEDGTPDKLDGCPDVPGPEQNAGCPWPDTDGDSVLDKDDDCPTEAGEAINNGCPWKDTDGDTLLDKDDKCPEQAGAVSNGGCPYEDQDNDGVLDNEDQCPEIAGTVANAGCPEVTAEVSKKLNDYAKTILFDYAKSSFKEETFPVLSAIRSILNEYPNARFTVEGHTDSSGSNLTNQRLSDSRANAVRDYLISEGIAEDRLVAVGYGESRPIDTNETKTGRANNRRVEVNLIKE